MSASQLWKLPDRDRLIINAFKKGGPRSAASRHNIEDVVSGLPQDAFVPSEIAHAILFMLFGQPSQHYNLNEFVASIKTAPRARQLNWNAVVKAFDVQDLRVGVDNFSRLFRALQQIAIDDQDFDIQNLWAGSWNHAKTQASFLRSFFEMLDVSPAQIPGFQPSFQASEFEEANTVVRKRIAAELENQQNNFFAMKAFFDVILATDALRDVDDASNLLHNIVRNHLFGFLLSLVHIAPAPNRWSESQEKFLDSCFRVYLEDQQSDSNLALEALFHQDRHMVSSLCTVVFHGDPRRTELIARKAQELGWTDFLLDSVQNPLALDIACLLQKERTQFDLEQWISNAIDPLDHHERNTVGHILWKFLRIKADDEYRSQKDQTPYQSIPLSLPAAFILLWKIQEMLGDRETVKSAQCTCLTTYPRLMNYGTGYDSVLEQASEERGHKLAAETDARMSELYGQMYRSEVTIRDMINEMRRYKTSQDPRLQDLFCCIVHGLFDEYGCYGEYPEEALEKTALLFGSIINFKLLPPIPQEYGLTLVVDAIRDNTPDSPMHRFGIEALLQVGDQLMDWPEICGLLLQIPGLQHSEIVQRAQEGMRSAQIRGGAGDRNGHNDFGLTNGSIDDLRLESGSKGFRSLHAEPASSEANFKDPDQESQEKILFIVNNLSQENMESKLAVMRDTLQPEHYQWFASYLVEQRARLEPNNQIMYSDFLALLDDSDLIDEVLRETYVSVVKVMSAKSTLDSQTERAHMKNLGAWLGSLTLARDKPIKHKNVYFIDLLLEGFESQRQIIVIPFTCKVLVQGARSMVFRPPNPWLMEILGVLLELYHYTDLKLTLKFEIEVLCKDLSLDHKKVEPATLIREFQQQQQMEDVLANASAMDNIDEYDLTLRGGRLRETFSVAEIMSSLPDLETKLRYPPPSGSPQDQMGVRKIITMAVQRAIEEIIAPVVERSITIASLSTLQLVSKDYATEASPDKFSGASREMVKSLAGSLALVTCKEPLRMSIGNYIRQYIEENGGAFLAEGQILMTVNDNLDIAASLIKDAAEQRAVPEMDQAVESELSLRHRFMAENPGGNYYGQNLNRWSTWIPEPYKMLPGGLNDAQRAVYEDFERRVNGFNAGHAQNLSTDSTGRQQLPDVLNESLAMPNLSTPAGQPVLPHQSPMTQQKSRANLAMPQQRLNGLPDSMPPHERLAILTEELQKSTRTSSTLRLKDLDRNNPIFQDLRQIVMLLSSLGHPTVDHIARQMAEKITTSLLRQPPVNQLEAEFLAFILNKLCNFSEPIIREVMRWITAEETSLLSNAWTTASLLMVGLMEFARIDKAIAMAVQDHSEVGLRLLRDLMELTLFNEEPNALRADWINSIISLDAWLKDEPEHTLALEIRNKLKTQGVPEYVIDVLNDKSQAKEDQMRYIFKEWSSIFENAGYNESIHGAFLRDMQDSQLLAQPEDIATFLRLSVEAATENFELEAQSFRASYNAAFSKVDALALLVLLFTKHRGEEDGAVKLTRASSLATYLTLLVLIANHHQQIRGTNFNARIFTRLISSLLHFYVEHKLDESSDHPQLMLTFADALKTLQPALFPGFAFGWTTLLSHRVLIEGILRSGNTECAVRYRELLGLMLQYPMPLIENRATQQLAENLMRGIWRTFFVLQTDFPDFICENHSFFCARISLRDPALRNIVLSALPSGLIEPNPLTQNLRVERIEDMKKLPVLAIDVSEPLENEGLLTALTQALHKSADVDNFVKQLTEVLSNEDKNQPSYSHPSRDCELLESLVVTTGREVLASNAKFDANSNAAQLITKLLTALDPRQRYNLLTAISDQLRYPNSHTEYFCKLALHIWGTTSTPDETQSAIREQIIRVLRERIEMIRPNPWGAIILFKELSENSVYGFWDMQPFGNEPELRQRMMVASRGH